MSAPTLAVTLHLRGMTDLAGSPNTEIATQKVEFWTDGTLRYTLDGIEYRLHPGSNTSWSRLFETIFTTNVTPLVGSE